jgi:hypothetical protein
VLVQLDFQPPHVTFIKHNASTCNQTLLLHLFKESSYKLGVDSGGKPKESPG